MLNSRTESHTTVEQGHSTKPRGVQPVSATPTVNCAPWHVCLTKPRQEAFAQSKLQEQGYELYLPQIESWARRAGRWVHKKSVMFPRYAFVRPSRPGQGVSAIRSTPGVSTLVKFGPEIACLSHDRLSALQALLAERAAAAPQQPLQAGQQVVFASGPLKGWGGLVSDVAAERVTVLMTLLGQEQRMSGAAHNLALA